MEKEEKILEEYLKNRELKHSGQRVEILGVLAEAEKHLTADELYRLARRKNPKIGYTTVYRTLKLLCECGLCREMTPHDGINRYEYAPGHEHHDHLICVKCGRFVEVVDPEIEKLQKKLAKKSGFFEQFHRMEIYGVCSKCKKCVKNERNAD